MFVFVFRTEKKIHHYYYQWKEENKNYFAWRCVQMNFIKFVQIGDES